MGDGGAGGQPAGNGQPGPSPLHEDDLLALAAFARGGEWLRGVACMLARRGVAFRLAHPERARALIDALERSPLYKMGQFLFDLTEWEDFMVDGPPPPPVPTALDARALARLATLLRRVQAHLDGSEGNGAGGPGGAGGGGPTISVAGMTVALEPTAMVNAHDEALPPLEAGFYLYQDVVLGALRSATPGLRGTQSPG